MLNEFRQIHSNTSNVAKNVGIRCACSVSRSRVRSSVQKMGTISQFTRLLQPADLSLYPINQAVLRIICKSQDNDLAQNQDKLQQCPQHHKLLELICIDDKCRICSNCALFGLHKQHNIQNAESLDKSIHENLQYTQQLTHTIQDKLKLLKLPLINKKIHDQIGLCIKQQQTLAEEQFKVSYTNNSEEIINQILAKQQKVLEEIEQKYKLLEDQFFKKEILTITSILDKADLWILGSNQKIQEYQSTKVKGDIPYTLLLQDSSNKQGKQILEEIDEYLLKFQNNLQDIVSAIPCANQYEQTYFDEPNILKDLSIIEQSFLKEIDEKPPHNEFLGSSLPESTCQSQPSSNNISQNAISPQQPHQKRASQQFALVSPKVQSRQQSASPKKPAAKKKLNTKVESILFNCNGDYLDLSQQDLGDDGILILEEQIRNKKVKIVKLMRNRISDVGAIKLMELHCQVLYLQSNVITEKFLDMIMNAIQKQIQIHIKTVYLGQNLINQFRVKKKIEDLKKLGISIQI
ncbi:unnamed protein product (macronuclear) [Paramecium tetraurelia]|uniref:B box-type domain-containing protein n=1 Tax=Paramecium tetraurelia TaxID=5888 RepID=A0BK25_PARTE|nr:uncharacterized protein GSPATT00029522001 [Paramecium tetraurelia]CAK58892.1 unnamed protein product [Paramecium tetraurelia]|eukprot:XP_001426290.1 hypothetical protein (macronuclear) [Paramecium tetraurelia strain d4-2]